MFIIIIPIANVIIILKAHISGLSDIAKIIIANHNIGMIVISGAAIKGNAIVDQCNIDCSVAQCDGIVDP